MILIIACLHGCHIARTTIASHSGRKRVVAEHTPTIVYAVLIAITWVSCEAPTLKFTLRYT